MVYPARVCERCGQEYIPTGNQQKHCLSCKLAIGREYYAQHREKYCEAQKEWRRDNPGWCRDYSREQQDRRRELGSECLNSPFEGSDGHHIDKDHVVYIPKSAHQSIRHNVWTGENMEEINAIARTYVAPEIWDHLQIESLFK